jgi:DNA-binding LytR/AlgR family response regulator
MTKIKVLIVEDEFVIAEHLRGQLVDEGYDVLRVFDRAEEAEEFLKSEVPDILLVDVRLKGRMTGIDLVREFRKQHTLPVIYITANSDETTYERARETQPQAFLVKPFTPSNLAAAVDLALYNYSISNDSSATERPMHAETIVPYLVNGNLFVRTNGRHKKIVCDDILFVEASGSYVHLHTPAERYTLSQNLTHFQRKSPMACMVRVHRSYIVNLNHVESFEESFVFVANHKIPLSDNYRAEFLSRVHCL